jgi:hypothetical protein
MDMNSKLCALCQSVITTTTPDELHDHHPDAKSLSKSAEAGCPLCTILADTFLHATGFKDSSVKFNDLLLFKYRLLKSFSADEEYRMYHFTSDGEFRRNIYAIPVHGMYLYHSIRSRILKMTFSRRRHITSA